MPNVGMGGIQGNAGAIGGPQQGNLGYNSGGVVPPQSGQGYNTGTQDNAVGETYTK